MKTSILIGRSLIIVVPTFLDAGISCGMCADTFSIQSAQTVSISDSTSERVNTTY